MKTYSELTQAQQEKAREKALNGLLEAVLEGAIKFSDTLNGDDLQARIDKAFEKAERNHTPWFAGELIMETCGDDLRSMSDCDAEGASYSEPGENVIAGIAE